MEGKEKMSQLEKSAVESNQKILSALIMEFKTQLAENYRQAQTALHKALQVSEASLFSYHECVW